MKIEFVASADAAEVLAVLVHEGRALAGEGPRLDTATSGALSKAMTASQTSAVFRAASASVQS